MSKEVYLDPEIYRRFTTALVWFSDDEKSVIEGLMETYIDSFIHGFGVPLDGADITNTTAEQEHSEISYDEDKTTGKPDVRAFNEASTSNAVERRRLFVDWLKW